MPQEVTRLTPEEDAQFQSWVAANGIQDLDHPDSHYDYRGFWKATKGAPHPPGSQQHFPDTFKQHGHPTFSVESQYSTGPGDGGSWNGDQFVPGRGIATPPPAAPAARTRQGGFHPSAVVKAYRDEHPGLFDGFDDKQLLDAIEREDPGTYKLVDPLLIGAELLGDTRRPEAPRQPPALPKLTPPPTPTSGFDTLVTTGLRTVPAVSGALLGTLADPVLGPFGTAGGGAIGSGIGETLAQKYEQMTGARQNFSGSELVLSSALGAFPAGSWLKTAGPAGRIGIAAAEGAGLGGTHAAVAPLLEDEARYPTLPEVGSGALMGGAFGGALGGVFEGVRALPHMASMGDVSGALPTDGGPPPGRLDTRAVAAAAEQVYRQEEGQLAGQLIGLYGPEARPARGDFHQAVQAKDYLQQLADLQVRQSQLQLAETAGPAGMGGPAARPVFPEGTDPNRVDVTGTRAPVLNEPAPTPIELAIETSLQEPPGPPRLTPMRERYLALTGEPLPPPEAAGPSQRSLLRLPYEEGRVRQTPDVGGAEPVEGQPRLPHVLEPRPVERGYPEGPNVGPRRRGEPHAQPRQLRRQIQKDGQTTYETYPSSRPAEDPGMYPPEVRRELSRMLWELDEFRYEKGGLLEGVPGGNRPNVPGQESHFTPNTPGAPVYHDILAAAEGARAHATRAEIVGDLRAALLEGKGSAVSDAAAEVARGRMAQEAGGKRGTFKLYSPEGAGDALIGWEDAQGTRALHELDHDPWQAAVREAEDGEILASLKIAQEGHLTDAAEPFFQAARAEAVRRGLIEPEQLELAMEGPGGARGVKLTDFEGNATARQLQGKSREEIQQLLDTYDERTGPGGEYMALPTVREGGPPGMPRPPIGVQLQSETAKLEALLDQINASTETRAQARTDLASGIDPRRIVETLDRRSTVRMPEEYAGAREWEPTPPPQPGMELDTLPPHLRSTPAVVEGGDVALQNPSPMTIRTMEAEGYVRGETLEDGSVVMRYGKPVAGSEAPPAPRLTGSRLRRFLEDESGVLVFDIPAGDRAGLRKWLSKHEEDYGDVGWFNRAEEAIEAGDWDRAWKVAAGASVRSYSAAYAAAKTPAEEAALRSAVRGTPLQSGVNEDIIGAARARTGAAQGAPPVRDFPPSARTTQAGAGRGKARVGPAGIIDPGPPQRPLRPQDRSHTLPRVFTDTVLSETDASLVHLVPGNTDSRLRLYRQVADLAFQGTNTRELKQYLKLSDQEIGQHYVEAVQEAARMLQGLSAYAQANRETLTAAAEQMSMGGALRGMLKGGRTVVGQRGKVIGKVGQIDPEATVAALASDTASFDQAMLANTLQKPKKASELELLQAASYPFMLARWRTAVRNAMSTAGRYAVDSLDEALTIPFAKIMGDTEGAGLASAMLQERTKSSVKGSALVTPRTAWKETLQQIYDFTATSLEGMTPRDARRTIGLLTQFPDREAHFLGAMSGGEDLAEGASRSSVLNALLDPKLQRVLTIFNRAQEFSGRGIVFDATMRGQLRASGHDPDVLLGRPFPEIQAAVGPQNLDDMLYGATAAALEATFSGQAARQSIPAALLQAINQIWPLKLGYPFPKFNLIAAPRWIYDHSPAALVEVLRFPLDTFGLTSGEYAGGRLYRGVRAQRLQQSAIPELAGKRQAATGRLGAATRELLATSREMATRNRQVKRLEGRAQSGLPDVATALEQATAYRDQLAKRRGSIQERVSLEKDRIRKLKAQEDRLLDVVKDAQGINAPSLPQYFARMTSGAAILAAAAVVRSSTMAEGTRWYELRADKADGSDPDILDFRPYAPFAQYLYVADVMQDLSRFTDWASAKVQAETDGWTASIWDNYQGKYTRDELGAEFGKAFLSISRAAGTTLTLTDLLTQNGWPSMNDATDAIIGTLGQFLGRFTTPLGDVKDLAAAVSPEEAVVRIPPKATLQEPYMPLAAPIANVPGASRLIPEKVSQTTGKPMTTTHPLLRALAGIGATPHDFVTEEVRRVGVPGPSVFIRETGDYGLDKLVAETYGAVLTKELPQFLKDPTYQGLKSPAQQRDFLQTYVFPALKRAALGEVRGLLGEDRFQAATVTGEASRRQKRRQALVSTLAGEVPGSSEPDSESGPPPAAPSPASAGAGPPPAAP